MMAIDTAEKRFSMLNFGDGTTSHLLFESDGIVDIDDRQHLLDCYSGVTFSGFSSRAELISLSLARTTKESLNLAMQRKISKTLLVE